jgi:hypothetical protein
MKRITKNPGGNQGSGTQDPNKVASILALLPDLVDALVDLPWTKKNSLTVDTWLVKSSRWEGSRW